jgi:hypothetical protein
MDGESLYRHGHEDHAGTDVGEQITEEETSDPAIAQDLAVSLVGLAGCDEGHGLGLLGTSADAR